jgi:tetratricopeptide (TPR) repeat protein
MPLMEANLLRQTALAHLAVCLHASCRGAESLEALHRLHSLQADYDFHYLAPIYPASFPPLMETRDNFEMLRLLHRKSPFELPAARAGKLLALQQRRRELHMLSRRIETALAQKANTVLVSTLKEVDDLSITALALAGLCARIAAVLESVGNFSEAIRYYREAELFAPLNPQINIALARCYRQIGDIEKLGQQLERLYGEVSFQENTCDG